MRQPGAALPAPWLAASGDLPGNGSEAGREGAAASDAGSAKASARSSGAGSKTKGDKAGSKKSSPRGKDKGKGKGKGGTGPEVDDDDPDGFLALGEQLRISSELRRRAWATDAPASVSSNAQACIALQASSAVRDAACHDGLWVGLVEEELDQPTGEVGGENALFPEGFWPSVRGMSETVPEGETAEEEVGALVRPVVAGTADRVPWKAVPSVSESAEVGSTQGAGTGRETGMNLQEYLRASSKELRALAGEPGEDEEDEEGKPGDQRDDYSSPGSARPAGESLVLSPVPPEPIVVGRRLLAEGLLPAAGLPCPG